MIRICTLALAAVVASQSISRADEPNLKSFTPQADSKSDEPMAKRYSLDKAVSFLDNAALQWTGERKCFTCHTNYAYLYVRPMIDANVQAHAEIRQSLEAMVTDSWVLGKPRWDAEVVATAAALAFNDSLTTKKLHPLTKLALNKIWTVQKEDGGIKWLLCKWPPMENDDHYGVTLAALAVGVAPEGYAKTPQAQKGLDGLRRWLRNNPPENLHHKAMLLWVAKYLDAFLSKDEQRTAIRELVAKQLPDGGWASPSLTPNWPRGDKKEHDFNTSDAYATGFTIFVLRQAGVPANDPALVKGVAWLKANQRESGRWFTRSLFRDNKHYLSHAGSAFAVMAIQACEGTGVVGSQKNGNRDLSIVVFRHHPGIIDTDERMEARKRDAAAIKTSIENSKMSFLYEGGLGSGYELSIHATDLGQWKSMIDTLIKNRTLGYYTTWGLNRGGYGLVPIY